MSILPENRESLENIKNKVTEALDNTPGMKAVAEDLKASQKSKDTDDPVDVYIYEPVSIRLAHRFIKLGVSANAVSIMSLTIGVGGSILFYPQNRWINLLGIVFEIIALILDFCDGQIARLTHTSSQFGRVLDGAVDISNFLAVYLSIGFRMMRETIPFTNSEWSFFIWIVLIIAMLCHASQARMADYYRGLHLFFLNGSNSSNMTRSKNLKAELAALPKGSPLYERIYRYFYLIYTKDQENNTPHAQRLLNALEENGGTADPALSEAYVSQSRRYIIFTNVLTYHVRAITLFVLLFLGLHAFYFPVVIVVLEAVKWYMIVKYEAVAKNVYERFFSEKR